MQLVSFVDLLDNGPPVDVIAKVSLLPTSSGGKTRTITDKYPYRPNHNFGGADNRLFYVGQIRLEPGQQFAPGETRTVRIQFLHGPELEEKLVPGCVWRIQEGSQLVGMATLVELVGEP